MRNVTDDAQLEESRMRFILIAVTTAGFIGSSASALLANPVTPAEAEQIKAALEAWGCMGGTMEKETEGLGYFEVHAAKCSDGRQYDIKLDKDFKMIITT
jgi:hypothetical protein